MSFMFEPPSPEEQAHQERLKTRRRKIVVVFRDESRSPEFNIMSLEHGGVVLASRPDDVTKEEFELNGQSIFVPFDRIEFIEDSWSVPSPEVTVHDPNGPYL